jgi:hypothetical protein
VARFGAGIVIYLGSIGVALVSAVAVLILTALVAVYYMVDQVTTPVGPDE